LTRIAAQILRDMQCGVDQAHAHVTAERHGAEVATEVGLHESTVSRAIARKYVRTPRGTLPLRAFFASGVSTEGGGEASSIAIQSMIRRLIEDENPRKPLSDAKLAELLKSSGVPVARRTVAKYREAMEILSSHERVRIA
jgi:RNA polymerase sigma-54 factor